MSSTPYIERFIREFNGRSREQAGAHDAHLASILEAIEGLPSPEKEERLVELIVERNQIAACGEPIRQASAGADSSASAAHP